MATAAALRILIIEGNTQQDNAAMAAAGLDTNSAQYAQAVSRFAPDVDIHFIHPADRADGLPAGTALGDFDGIILGGSGLFVRAQGNASEVQRQVDLIRAVFDAGVPLLGSCWGLQVAAIAAGGEVERSPNGREVGICRAITLSDAGVGFPMFRGKPRVFDSLAIHYDEVKSLPPGTRVLASNGHSPVQAAVFGVGKGVFWGVQYHPEFTLAHMARLIRRYGSDMVAQGIYSDQAKMDAATEDMLRLDRETDPVAAEAVAAEAYAAAGELEIDGSVLDPDQRCREIDNWLRFCRSEKADRICL